MANELEIKREIICENAVPNISRVIEMVNTLSLIDVPINPMIKIEDIIVDDPDPKFVNVEIIRARTSGNKFRYNNDVIREINDLVPGVQAFFGHPDPTKFGFEFREPQGIYVGSLLEQMRDGVSRSIGKCYLFKSSALREWVPKSIAAGNPMTVSINGSADVISNNGFKDVLHITELQSIDWANPGTEGINTSQALSVVREQQQNIEAGGNNMDPITTVDAKSIISNVTVAELKTYNRAGYEQIISGVTVQELQNSNPQLFSQIQESAKVLEMNLTVGGKQESVKLTELQGRIDGFETKITELQGEITKSKLSSYKEKKIGELVPEKLREMVTKRVNGNTETEIDASIDSEITYIREMGGLDNLPKGGKQTVDGNIDIKEAVSAMFGNAVKAKK